MHLLDGRCWDSVSRIRLRNPANNIRYPESGKIDIRYILLFNLFIAYLHSSTEIDNSKHNGSEGAVGCRELPSHQIVYPISMFWGSICPKTYKIHPQLGNSHLNRKRQRTYKPFKIGFTELPFIVQYGQEWNWFSTEFNKFPERFKILKEIVFASSAEGLLWNACAAVGQRRWTFTSLSGRLLWSDFLWYSKLFGISTFLEFFLA